MNQFHGIDNKLQEFAAKCNAELQTSGSWYYKVPPEKIEERKIIWVEGVVGKAVLIQPHFENDDFDSPLWMFVNTAWLDDGKQNRKDVPFWEKELLGRVEFSEIEKNIDKLLNESYLNLQTINLEDLKVQRNSNFSVDVVDIEVDE